MIPTAVVVDDSNTIRMRLKMELTRLGFKVVGESASGGKILELYEQHELVTEGPYRFVRHPMYTSVYLKGIGILLLSANWIAGGGYLAAVTWMYASRVRDEEQMMVERFGEEYRNYMSRTSRLVPLPRR